MNENRSSSEIGNSMTPVGKLATEAASPLNKMALTGRRKKETKNLMKREGIWYFHKLVKGKREFSGRKTPFSLETRDLVVAKAKRDAILRAHSGSEVDRILGTENANAPTIGKVFQIYRQAPMIRANTPTRIRNMADLVRMVRIVKGPQCDVEAVSTVDLTWDLVEQWQAKRLRVFTDEAKGDQAALEASKRGLNTVLRCTQSIFSIQARAAYRNLHLPPNIEDFASAMPLPARKQEEPRHFTDDFMLQLVDKAQGMLTTDVGAWACFQLMMWGGLRNSEALHSRTTWLEKTAYGYKMSLKPTDKFTPKGNSREVILPTEVAEALLALPRRIDQYTLLPDDHLVPATSAKDRMEACFYRLNTWLKAQGVGKESGKVAYRLRKYFLKKVAVQQHPLMAQSAAGHSSMETTTAHYIGKPKMMEPIRLPVNMAEKLSFRLDQKPENSPLQIGTILKIEHAAQLLEMNAADLARRSERANSIAMDGYVLTVRREGLNGALVASPAVAT